MLSNNYMLWWVSNSLSCVAQPIIVESNSNLSLTSPPKKKKERIQEKFYEQ